MLINIKMIGAINFEIEKMSEEGLSYMKMKKRREKMLKIEKETEKKNYNRDWDWFIIESTIGIIILIICYLLQNVI